MHLFQLVVRFDIYTDLSVSTASLYMRVGSQATDWLPKEQQAVKPYKC